jgi:2-keto-4-pentenoate hydratase
LSDIDELVATLLENHNGAQPYPLPSQAIAGLDVSRAYVVQKAYVAARLRTGTIGGFKAALTAEPAQQAFGLAMPVTGVLFDSGLIANGAQIEKRDFHSLLLETELGYRLTQTLSEPVASTAALREIVGAAFPMVELADPGFGAGKATGEDLVAANAASARYLGEPGGETGARAGWADKDLNSVQVRFTRDGETLHDASATDVMGDQWQALLWLVNQIVAQGYVIKPDHVLMTGSIGRMHPGVVGNYEADYGNFGKLTFEIV